VRIIHVIAEMDPGGAERIVVDLAADAVGLASLIRGSLSSRSLLL